MVETECYKYYLDFSNIVNNFSKYKRKEFHTNTNLNDKDLKYEFENFITKIYENIENLDIENFILSRYKEFNNTPYANIFELMFYAYVDIKDNYKKFQLSIFFENVFTLLQEIIYNKLQESSSVKKKSIKGSKKIQKASSRKKYSIKWRKKIQKGSSFRISNDAFCYIFYTCFLIFCIYHYCWLEGPNGIMTTREGRLRHGGPEAMITEIQRLNNIIQIQQSEMDEIMRTERVELEQTKHYFLLLGIMIGFIIGK